MAGTAMANEPVAVGALSINPIDDMYEITAMVEGRSPQVTSVEAELAVVKSDRSGSVQTRQSKTVEVQQGSRVQVARTGVSLGREGTLEVTLIIEENGKVVDRVVSTVLRNQAE
jgi:hypothetical protein